MKWPRLRSPHAIVLFVACFTASCANQQAGEDNVAWVGHSYQLSIASHQWSEPRGLGDDVGPYIPVFLIKVEGAGNELDVTITTAAADGKQDPCNKTIHVDATAMYPALTIGPAEFKVRLINDDPTDNKPGVEVYATAHDFTLTDVLPGGDGNGSLSATMDAREIYPLFTLLGDGATPDDLCAELADQTNNVATCQPCPTDDEPYCLTLKAARVEATEFDGSIDDISKLGASCTQ